MHACDCARMHDTPGRDMSVHATVRWMRTHFGAPKNAECSTS